MRSSIPRRGRPAWTVFRPSFVLQVLSCAVSIAQAAHGQQPTWQHPPKLIVGIVVDQMRTDYLYRYWDNFGDGGFKRLINEGTFLRDAHYTYMPTVTGPGHASIYAGTAPGRHGIVANDMYDRARHATYYCVSDTAMSSVGTTSSSGEKSPHRLLASTLADEMELRFARRSKTIGIAIKDRSAILPIGRTGDAAFWFSGGAFISSSWYGEELPRWVADYNGTRPVDRLMVGRWEPALPRERYHEVLPDDNPYEIPLKRGMRPKLPVDLDSLRLAGAGADVLPYTPAGLTVTTDLALAALTGEALGKDDATDLLAISYSSPDLLGHRVGPRAVEMEDMYIRLDGELKRLLDELDRLIGPAQYTVFLTADHATADVPAYIANELKGSAGYVDMAAIQRTLATELGLAIDTVMEQQVFLQKPGESDARRVAERLALMPGIAAAITGHQAVRGAPGDGLPRLMAAGFMPQRSGDVLFALQPGHFEKESWSFGHGTTHGSGWTYDTHVPVIFFGAGVRQGEVLRRTAITDIAPTISALVGMTAPNAASGEVVPEALR